MALRASRSAAKVAVFMVLALSAITSASGAAVDPCTLDASGAASQSCVKALKSADTLKIACGSAAQFAPGPFSAPSDPVCKVALTGGKCDAKDQTPFSTLVAGVGVAKSGGDITVTAPSSVAADVSAFGSCTSSGKTMAFEVQLKKGGAADVFASALPTAVLAVLISSMYIVS